MLRQLRHATGFRVVGSQHFPSTLGPSYANSELQFALSQAQQVKDAKLRAALLDRVAAMRAEARRFKAQGQNYAIVVRRE